MAIASDKMVFYYMARENLCFLTLCEEAYPKRTAFLYLDDIADVVTQELQKEHGANVGSVVYRSWWTLTFVSLRPLAGLVGAL